MAGGDGALAVVATAAAGHGLPFACVPAGTRNHFALDVGVDRHDLAGALDAFTDGVERRIDAAEVNGRLFLNNVSLGIYGDAVRMPGYRDAKVRTLPQTAQQVLGPSAQVPELRLVDEAGREHRHLAVVLVSSNPYALDRPPVAGTRPALDTGQLGILVLDAPDDGPFPPGQAWSAPHSGVLIGLWWHPLGVAAAAGMALLLLGAVLTHRRAADSGKETAPALAALALTLAYLAIALTS